jgi:hypothetical protein
MRNIMMVELEAGRKGDEATMCTVLIIRHHTLLVVCEKYNTLSV